MQSRGAMEKEQGLTRGAGMLDVVVVRWDVDRLTWCGVDRLKRACG